jgi:pimeloyl-ACP methyl ester carboxylesterase/DNA-binding CsgD family transcriptional regulator
VLAALRAGARISFLTMAAIGEAAKKNRVAALWDYVNQASTVLQGLIGTRAMNQKIKFCTTRDGAKLAYALSGDGPPIVMSATWLTHLEHQWHSMAWRPWLEAFSCENTLLRYDSRGCGLSDRAVDDVSFETWVNDLERVVDASGFERFALLGTCQGGPIAMEYAARHPQRVSRLVLYGTYARGRYKRTGIPNQMEKAKVLLELLRLGWGRENHAFLQVWAAQFQPGGSIEHLRSWSDQQRAATSAETAARLLPISWHLDMTETASRITVPTMVLHPEHDAVVPIEEGRLLAGLIPDCRFVQLDGQNHMPLADEPIWPKLLAEVRGFLAEDGSERSRVQNVLPLGALTSRERNVLECIARGLDNSEIAASLGLSEKTVRNHITRVFDKIGVEHRYQAIVRAREAGLGLDTRLARSP